jgi:membrane associated rhomboid family serine protease
MDLRDLPGAKGRRRRFGTFIPGFRGPRASQFRLGYGMLVLILATSAVSLACAVWPALRPHLVLIPERTLRAHELWQPLTATFAHLEAGSFVFHLLMLWLMGGFVEQAIGARRSIQLCLVTATVGYLVAAGVGLWLAPGAAMAGTDPFLFVLLAAGGVLYGRQQVLFFGAMPARADVISWIFCGIWLVMLLAGRDFVGVARDLAAFAISVLMLRRGMMSATMKGAIPRLRLWWLRRRYKVIDGGKGKKTWLN